MNVIELLQGQLSEGMIDLLSDKIGGGSREQTQTAASGILSTLVTAISKNAAQPEGANALVSALDRDHDGSIMDDVAGFLGGGKQPTNERTMNGSGIIKHVLGDKQSNVTDMIGKMSGMDTSKVGGLMQMLAPMVMGALGKARHQEGLDPQGISQLLQSNVKSEVNQKKEMGLISRFLDQDGDGSVLDDLANMGLKALFGRK